MPNLQRAANVAVHYEVWGEQGPWLTFINGYTRPSSDFKLWAKRLQQEGYRVLSLDNRGSGKTLAPRGFSLADMAEDIVALWQSLNISASQVLGISMGGLIAQYLAAHYGAKVRSLLLVSTTGPASPLTLNSSPWPKDPTAVQKKLQPYFSPQFLQGNHLLIEAMAKNIAAAAQEGSFNEGAQRQREAITAYLPQAASLDSLSMPTLIIHGEDDLIIPPQAAYDLQKSLPHSELLLIPAAGHLLLAEKAQLLYESCKNFWQKHK